MVVPDTPASSPTSAARKCPWTGMTAMGEGMPDRAAVLNPGASRRARRAYPSDMRSRLLICLVLALVAGGCSDGDDGDGARATPGPTATGSVPAPAATPEAGAEDVIR